MFCKIVSWLLRRPNGVLYEDAVVWEDRFGLVEVWYDWSHDQIMATTTWWYTLRWNRGSRPRIEIHFIPMQETRFMGP